MSGQHKPRGSKDEQYARREAGARMLLSGRYRQAEIADALGVSHGTVRGWSSQLQTTGGRLPRKAQRGRRKGTGRALTQRQERQMIALIRDKNPKQLKLPFYLWSVGAVTVLIEKKCGVLLSESATRKYLKAWGFTIQRPATRYTSRDDVAVQRWLEEEYPAIAAQARLEGAEIHWLFPVALRDAQPLPAERLDETGINNQAVYQRSIAINEKFVPNFSGYARYAAASRCFRQRSA